MSDNGAVQTYDTTQLAEINRSEIDMQISTAKKYPRDESNAINRAIQLASRKAETVLSCQYFRPVAKKDGIQAFASGFSIRMAEIMKTSWGNIRIAKRVIGTRDGMVGVEWGVHDLESNMMDRGEVWRPYWGKDNMIPVITAAALKFAERDAVSAAIPKAVMEEVWDSCKKVIIKDDAARNSMRQMLEEKFQEMGVAKSTVYSVIDRKHYPDGSDEEVFFLLGLNNAIKDGLVDAKDVFGEVIEKPKGRGNKGKNKDDKKTEKKQTPQQRLNTLRLELDTSGKMDEVKGLIKEHTESNDNELPDFTDDQVVALCDELEKLK